MILIGSTVLAALALGVGLAILYNRFVKLRVFCDEAYSGIDVQLKRRHDLIPKLVSVVQGASGFEKSALTQVTEARQQAGAAQGLAERESAETALGAALGRLLVVAEAYPELKSVQAFLDLQKEVSAIEDALQYARRYYNACVREHNAYGQTFPALLMAGAVGFELRRYFMLEDASEARSPKVEL